MAASAHGGLGPDLVVVITRLKKYLTGFQKLVSTIRIVVSTPRLTAPRARGAPFVGKANVRLSFVRIAPPGRRHGVTNRRCYKGRMTIELSNHEVLSDPELLVEVRRLAGQERKATTRLIA